MMSAKSQGKISVVKLKKKKSKYLVILTGVNTLMCIKHTQFNTVWPVKITYFQNMFFSAVSLVKLPIISFVAILFSLYTITVCTQTFFVKVN